MTGMFGRSESGVNCLGEDKTRPSTEASVPSISGKRSSMMTSYNTDLNPILLSLDTLPYVVIRRLLLFLDVDSLENLSSTCSLFQYFVTEKFNTSLDLSCPMFITDLVEFDTANKPLLRVMLSRNIIGIDAKEEALNILDKFKLDYVREIRWVPDSIDFTDKISSLCAAQVIGRVARIGSLNHVTRLDITVDERTRTDLVHLVAQMRELNELSLVCIFTGLSERKYQSLFLPRLQEIVAASKAPFMKIDIKYDNRNDPHHIPKVLRNKFVERLVVTGPATYYIVPVMERLKEVEVVVNEMILTGTGTDWKSEANNRNLLKGGICCVHIGALYGYCPGVKKFMGMEIASVTPFQPCNRWNKELKLLFYKDYINQGGTMGLQEWAKIRWFSNIPIVEL